MELWSRSVVAQGSAWGGYGCEGSTKEPCGDGAFLYHECGNRYMNRTCYKLALN